MSSIQRLEVLEARNILSGNRNVIVPNSLLAEVIVATNCPFFTQKSGGEVVISKPKLTDLMVEGTMNWLACINSGVSSSLNPVEKLIGAYLNGECGEPRNGGKVFEILARAGLVCFSVPDGLGRGTYVVRQSADSVSLGRGFWLSDVVLGASGTGVSEGRLSKVTQKNDISFGVRGMGGASGGARGDTYYRSTISQEWTSPPLIVTEALRPGSEEAILLKKLFTNFTGYIFGDLKKTLEVRSERGGVELGGELIEVVLGLQRENELRSSEIISTSYDPPPGVTYIDENFSISEVRNTVETTTTRRELRANLSRTFSATGTVLWLDNLCQGGAKPEMILVEGRRKITLAQLVGERQKRLMADLPRRIGVINNAAQEYAELLMRQMQERGLILSPSKANYVDPWVRTIHAFWAVQAMYETLKVNYVLESLKRGRAVKPRFFPSSIN